MPFSEAVKDFPMAHINTKPPHVIYSFWQLLEHIRLSQLDILEYILNPNYKESNWPEDYWPQYDATESMWKETITMYNHDLEKAVSLLENPETDLFQHVFKKDGPTLFHELLLVADHTSYHIGEFGILRQVMQIWSKGHK